MKRMGYCIIFLCLVSGLLAQQEPKIRENGENFTYAALECLGPYTQMKAIGTDCEKVKMIARQFYFT